MEKEQIVKVLECCAEGNGITDCRKCPFQEDCDASELARLALSLIREQEKRIEELTLENAGLYAGAKVAAKFVRADTVRKMQKMLKKTFSALCKGEMIDLFHIIDQIAKQLTEDKA